MTHWFVGFPKTSSGKAVDTFLYKADRSSKIKQVFWGDWLSVDTEHPDGWLELTWGPMGQTPQKAFFPKAHAANMRPLEIVFLDVGQGDGAVLISPEFDNGEAVIVIDAGKGDEMHRFLDARFKTYQPQPQFHAAVITHPDQDHYGGFEDIFMDQDIGFDIVYQNGLVERPVSGQFEKVGGVADGFISDLALGKAQIAAHFTDTSQFGRKVFPPVMNAALTNPRIGNFSMLSRGYGTPEAGRTYMPGFAPADGRPYSIEVVGPVIEPDAAGQPRLRKLGSYAETKNGHSVLLRLHFGSFKVLFGGDLNAKAEKFLLKQATGLASFPSSESATYRQMITDARDWFAADIMKVCHHGAADVTDAFIEAVGPTGFVISSGDREGHVHPRPDLLGRLGKLGASSSPVILSTELQRSTRDREDRKTVDKLIGKIQSLTKKPTETQREKMVSMVNELGRTNVQVYGTIYLKTDGQSLVTAFKKETESETDRWFHFEYKIGTSGQLTPVS